MIIEISVPGPGESITEVELANWLVNTGDYVEKDQEIAEIESDKATLPLIAEKSGKIEILVKAGETVAVGTVACKIDTGYQDEKVNKKDETVIDKTTDDKAENKLKHTVHNNDENDKAKIIYKNDADVKITPLAKKMMQVNNISVNDLANEQHKITSKDIDKILTGDIKSTDIDKKPDRTVQRKKMSSLRRKLSDRLVAVKNETAMLTTFNEVDMSAVIQLRKKYQEKFTRQHGIKLGLISFFIKASAEALKIFPGINSMIEGDEIITPHYVDISVAVQTEKGLMVPVLRNADSMSLADIELTIKELADKARNFRLSIEEMEGGTFTITNGGVFGSMLSTPILNPPQSGILGMHNIVDRPVAINGKVEVRPVMYLALSYDHRIVDGRDSVSFLVKIKELIEDPVKILTGGKDLEKLLLDIEE